MVLMVLDQNASSICWTSLAAVAAITFTIANAIACVLKYCQDRRIQQKTVHLQSLRSERKAQIPVTLITGYLGAGKTTLFNRILQSTEHTYRILALVNEFGETSIDHKLLKNKTTPPNLKQSNVFVFKNGCMCCSSNTKNDMEIESILDKLIYFSKKQPDFDYVVLETTGLADPVPIIQMFERLRMDGSAYCLDGVVTLVDTPRTPIHTAGNTQVLARQTKIKPMQRRQIAMGDVLVLSKCDLMPSAKSIDAVESALRRINPLANITRCSNGIVKVSSVLGLGAFDSQICARRLQGIIKGVHSSHMSGIMTTSLRINAADATTTVAKIQGWIQWLVNSHRGRLLRVKGILKIQGMPQQFVIQGIDDDIRAGVGEMWNHTPHSPALDLNDPALECRLNFQPSVVVIIGYNLHQKELQQRFEGIFNVRNTNMIQ